MPVGGTAIVLEFGVTVRADEDAHVELGPKRFPAS
jgi:hypothetical protein